MEAVFLRSIEFKNEPASIQPYKYNTYSNITNDVNSRFTQSLGLAAGGEKESSHVFELGKTGELNRDVMLSQSWVGYCYLKFNKLYI